MKLVSIGATTINMDTVREIRVSPELLTIVFIDGYETQLRGVELEGFKRWLTSNAEQVLEQPHHQGTTQAARR